jgi:uncharacterized membrane protein YhaH (DUF805 family)
MQGLRAFQRYSDFSGRSGRAEYWQFFGIFTAAAVVAAVLDATMGNEQPVLLYLIAAMLLVPYFAVSTRRLHDRAVSAKVLFIQTGLAVATSVFPYEAGKNVYTTAGDVWTSLMHVANYALLATNIGLLVLMLGRGTAGPNRFGPDPSTVDGPPPSVGDLLDRAKSFGSAQPLPRGSTQSVRSDPPATPSDPIEQIARLAELRDSGALTEAEFAERKAALLARV